MFWLLRFKSYFLQRCLYFFSHLSDLPPFATDSSKSVLQKRCNFLKYYCTADSVILRFFSNPFLALWKLQLLVILTAQHALVSLGDDLNLSWKQMWSIYDSVEQPGKYFILVMLLQAPISMSAPNSQEMICHYSFYSFILLYY